MANPELLEEQREETRLIIEELLEDGSDPDALYTIEHHFSADDFDALEKMAVEAFKLAQPKVEVHVYEADHGFNCDQRGSYNEAAAVLANERTLAFFKQHLG